MLKSYPMRKCTEIDDIEWLCKKRITGDIVIAIKRYILCTLRFNSLFEKRVL